MHVLTVFWISISARISLLVLFPLCVKAFKIR